MYPVEVSIAYNNLITKLALKEKLDKEIGALRESLKSSIPDNQSIAGVYHKVIQRKNVRYADALKLIINSIVAESKRGRAWSIVEDHTTYSDVHSYEFAKDSAPAKEEDLA